jgi:hypothetical protein
MRILFDQGTPAPLHAFLTDDTVRTAKAQGRATFTNGAYSPLPRAQALTCSSPRTRTSAGACGSLGLGALQGRAVRGGGAAVDGAEVSELLSISVRTVRRRFMKEPSPSSG